jgi:Set1/Ash2 histone methyltransferase complex subunit ASH2
MMETHLLCYGIHRFPKEYPFNREPYRYVLAEADPHAPFRQVCEHKIATTFPKNVIRVYLLLQEFDEASDMAGKPIPGFLCRVLTPQIVLLSLHDRAPQVDHTT